jgi:FKBP-type peptidyl-prolyl cis-trans isomerase
MDGLSSSIEILKTRNGRPIGRDKILLSYVAALTTEALLQNDLVDSSAWHDRPMIIDVGESALLPGLGNIFEGRCFGDTIRIVVPSDMAFGARGVPGRVPPGASLVFDIEFVTAGQRE